MNPWVALGAAILGYVCGSISFARIVTRIVSGSSDVAAVDLESPDGGGRLVSDAVSATAVRLQLGTRWGVTVGVLDVLKALIPTLAMRLLFPGEPYVYLTGFFTVVGHNWPVFYGFKGGRGQSPALGAMIAIAPLGALVTNVIGSIVGFLVVRDAMVSDNLGQVLYVPWVWFAGLGPWAVAWAVAINVVFFGSYLGEISQYAALRRAGHIRSPDDMMRMMRLDRDGLTGRRKDEDP